MNPTKKEDGLVGQMKHSNREIKRWEHHWRGRWRAGLLTQEQVELSLKLGFDFTPHTERWWSWKKARAYARSLGFTSSKQWRKWRSTSARPNGLPSHPVNVYKKEWRGYASFLNTGNPQRKQWA